MPNSIETSSALGLFLGGNNERIACPLRDQTLRFGVRTIEFHVVVYGKRHLSCCWNEQGHISNSDALLRDSKRLRNGRTLFQYAKVSK